MQEPRQAIVVLTEALAAAKQHSRNSTESSLQCKLAMAHAELGEFEDALVHAEAALRLMRAQGGPALETSIRQALARAMTGLRRLAEAREHLAHSLRLALSERSPLPKSDAPAPTLDTLAARLLQGADR